MPAVTPVTTPEVLIVATAVFEETHGLVVAGEALPVKVRVAPIQPFKFPVIIGKAFTIIVAEPV